MFNYVSTTDEGSSPKRLVIQALGYILNLTKFMYLLVTIAARTNKHFMFDKPLLKYEVPALFCQRS